MWSCGAKEVFPGKEGDLIADLDPIAGREAIVHSPVDARLGDLVDRLGESAIGAHWVHQARDGAVDGEIELVRPEEVPLGWL